MAGAFGLYEYELSKKIADKKVAAIKSIGADIIATGCTGCEVQLLDAIARARLPVKVMHVMDLVQ
jgi:glycolate oxidase iron-sulfur subunit